MKYGRELLAFLLALAITMLAVSAHALPLEALEDRYCTGSGGCRLIFNKDGDSVGVCVELASGERKCFTRCSLDGFGRAEGNYIPLGTACPSPPPSTGGALKG